MRLVLSARERELLDKYGYPFTELENELAKHRDHIAPVSIAAGEYWWTQALGNLAITVNDELPPGALCDEVNALADRIELELQSKDQPPFLYAVYPGAAKGNR